MADPPLALENFGRRYRRSRRWAVRGVSLWIPPGSITALVGPNGAGKSTIIRACVGFERPDEGRLFVFGHDPVNSRAQAVSHVGYVPQSASLYGGLTIADHFNLAAAARPSFDRGVAESRVADAGLDMGRKAGQLSGGEQAQVALAIALGTRAPLLLLDEPLASLDPLARRDFLTALLRDVKARGATALLSSHIVTDVEQACDRLIVLAGGRLVLDASVAEAKASTRILPAADVNGTESVGIFSGPAGERLALVRDLTVGREATVEEVVLGHLASSRGDTFGD